MTRVRRCTTVSPPPSLPSLLSSCKTLRSLEQAHGHIIRKGSEQDHYLITLFISLLSPLSLPYASSVFDRVSSPNIYLYNTLLKAHSRLSPLSHSFSFFTRLARTRSKPGPDSYTFPCLIRACSNDLALIQGEMVHGFVIKYGFDDDLYVGSSLVNMYGKCGKVLCARKVFDGMRVRNEVSWTAMIVGYVVAGDLVGAKNVFGEMPVRNLVSWNTMVDGLVKMSDLASARKLFDQMPERDVVSYTAMIDGYAKAGDMASARFLFEQFEEKDLVSWSALISGYAQNNQPHEAVKMFLEMQSKKMKPDEFILVSLMSACSQIGSLEMAKWVDCYVRERALDIRQQHVIAALIYMNAKCGNMERAISLFQEMPKRDLISFCSMIQGLSIHGFGNKAVLLFHRMINEGIVPDTVAFTVILTACSRAGLVEEGCRIFTSMIKNYSLIPSPDQYSCMVDLFGRAGKLKEACELLKLMFVEPHVGVWGALLGACKLHCDIELAEEIASRLFEIEPLNAGNYVAMSDIYAQVDRWLDVSLMREKMYERDIRKLCGCSRISIIKSDHNVYS